MYVQYVCMYVCIDRFLLCLYFYVSGAVVYDHSACSMICDSGAFFVSASLYYSLQTSPYSDPGSASFNTEDCS